MVCRKGLVFRQMNTCTMLMFSLVFQIFNLFSFVFSPINIAALSYTNNDM